MRIKIGAVFFDIIGADGLKDGDILLNGIIKFEDETITYDKNLSPSKRKITLLHELVHGIINHAGGVHDERQIEMLSNGLHQVLSDNEEVMKQILWGPDANRI